jgi:hypothetical protein
MHPRNFVTKQEEDSIAKVHMRADTVIAEHLERQLCSRFVLQNSNKPWRGGAARHGLNGAGKWLRARETPHDVNVSILASLHHRLLWQDLYINHGALDEQISNRVRYEARHFWNAKDEATLKLQELVRIAQEQAEAFASWGVAVASFFDIQKRVMNDAIPAHYKLAFSKLSHQIKRALAKAA